MNGKESKDINITKEMLIADALKAKPKAAAIFFSFGMPCLGCVVALNESIGDAAATHGIDLDELLKKINEA